MVKKRILLTGSNGLLGQKIVYALLQKPDVELIATSKGDNRLIQQQGYHYASMDISNQEEVLKLIQEYKPQHIIHGAAMTNVDACELDQPACKAQNIDATRYITEAANLVGAHLVHVSTDFIFDGLKGDLYTEDDEANPVSYYGWSKLEAEKIVINNANDWAICRTILVYGVVDHMSRSNVVLWAKGALEKGTAINVVDDQYRSPTLAEDLAAGCILAVDKHANGIFNISGKDYMSIFELVQRVAAFYGLSTENVNRSSSEGIKQPAKRPPRTGFVLDKAMRDLGYNPHSFEEGLELLTNQLTRIQS